MMLLFYSTKSARTTSKTSICNFTVIFISVLFSSSVIFKDVKCSSISSAAEKNSSGIPIARDLVLDKKEMPPPNGCGQKFILSAMNENITKYCVNLIGMRMENFPPRKEDLVKINYDDKCFSKCYLTEIEYLNDGDNFDRTNIMKEIKKTTQQDRWSAVLKATNRCISSTETMAKDEGGVSNSICKYSLVFLVCQRDEEKRMTC